MTEITDLLQRSADGERGAADRLYTLLYAELKRLARSHLAGAGPITLDPNSILHEVWLRTQGQPLQADNRRRFFAHASVVMRSVIVDHVRARSAAKRGGGAPEVTLDTAVLDSAASEPRELLRVHEALQLFERVNARAHRVVELRFFGGLELEEIALELGVSVPTVKRDWRLARAFLHAQLGA